MARQQLKIQAADFRGGLITEASPLNYPENSAIEISNLDVNIDGSVRRRKGLRQEPNAQNVLVRNGQGFPVSPNVDVETYVWRNAAGDAESNLVVVKTATRVSFYRETDSVSSNKLPFELNLMNFATGSEEQVARTRVDMAFGRGYMFVVGKFIEPLVLSYNASTNAIDIKELDLKKRDFDGLDDGLEVDERPFFLSSRHFYNLLNQGWDRTKIGQYRSQIGRFPSNADIWHAGRDAENEFDPKEMNKINFGNTPAPKGKFITNLFNTTVVVPPEFRKFIADITLDSANNQAIVTVTVPHELEEDDEIEIKDNKYYCVSGTGDEQSSSLFSYDGRYNVTSILNINQFIISTNKQPCANELRKPSVTSSPFDGLTQPPRFTSTGASTIRPSHGYFEKLGESL